MDEQILREEEELERLQGLNDSFSPLPRVALPAEPAHPDEEQVESDFGDTQNPMQAHFKSAPVEQRLLLSAVTYQRNKHALRQQQLDQEARAAQSPGINLKSQIIVQKLNREGPVEERLIRGGQLVDLEKQESLIREEQDARKNAHPSITPVAARLERPEAVSERLHQFQRLYQDNLHRLKEQLDQQLSFRPQINRGREPNTESTGRKSPLPEQPTFQPKLSKRSLQIAARLGKPRERLVACKSKEVLPDESPSFRPVINKRSELLDYRSHGSRGHRWETLYEARREQKEQPVQEDKLEDECTFRPKILTSGVPSQPQEVVQRLLDWSETKKLKAQQAKNSCADKDLVECTFMPSVLSTQLYEPTTAETPASTKGVDKFLERQRQARRRKEEVEERLHTRSKSDLSKVPPPAQDELDFVEAVRLLHAQVLQL